jgi:hypothetical protein
VAEAYDPFVSAVSNFPLAMHVSFEAKVPVIINDICS